MIYFIYFISLFLLPITLSVFLYLKNDKEDNKIDKLKEINIFLLKIWWYVFVICFISLCLNGIEDGQNTIRNMMIYVCYINIFLFLLVFVNYFSTRYIKFKICIYLFLKEIINFIKQNFVLNLMFFILIVFINFNKELTIGLIGSYFFFVLTTIHAEYKQKIKKENQNFKILYVIFQVILNLYLILVFTDIEKNIVQYINSNTITIDFNYTIRVLIFSLVIIINNFIPWLEIKIESIKKIFLSKKNNDMLKNN